MGVGKKKDLQIEGKKKKGVKQWLRRSLKEYESKEYEEGV